ncbi:hypothetical protein [Paenibacillus ottowii]|uniref:Uncharacterized protein n=1 Tax=Paenibacillus ottowii TaxID=2315729 RepID=A0ABY3BAX7_9BACL|nr:hypothetical protein [Paenibacillus ottowii]TQS01403.1 hypothetical protein FKV70_03460 [Paenibacillus ottowii]TQS01458.1 hypothetical protein FKV70_03750 [Paenibacillus ottowii]
MGMDPMVIDHLNCHDNVTQIKKDLIELLCIVQQDEVFTREMISEKIFKAVQDLTYAEEIHFGVIKGFYDEQTKSLNNTLAGR